MTLSNGLRITRWRNRLFLARGALRMELDWSKPQCEQRLIRLILNGY